MCSQFEHGTLSSFSSQNLDSLSRLMCYTVAAVSAVVLRGIRGYSFGMYAGMNHRHSILLTAIDSLCLMQ